MSSEPGEFHFDSSGSTQPIYNYEIYRRIDDLPSPPLAMGEGLDSPADAKENREILAYPDGDWHFLTEVPAHGEDIYHMVVPTLEDSCVYNDSTTAGDPAYYSTFFIRAATAVPTTYYDSSPDSSYSVDDLAPATPVGVYMTEALILQWDDNEEPDLGGYYIYAKVEESDEGVRLGTVIVSEYDLVMYSNMCEDYHFWGVSAFDINGNESPVEEIAWIPTDVEEFDMPRVDFLEQNHPNPFNPSTTIHFGLKRPSDVNLRIFDVAGRLIRVLADGQFGPGEYTRIWNGRSDSGSQVASGVYFYRMDAGEFVQTKKMVLLK